MRPQLASGGGPHGPAQCGACAPVGTARRPPATDRSFSGHVRQPGRLRSSRCWRSPGARLLRRTADISAACGLASHCVCGVGSRGRRRYSKDVFRQMSMILGKRRMLMNRYIARSDFEALYAVVVWGQTNYLVIAERRECLLNRVSACFGNMNEYKITRYRMHEFRCARQYKSCSI